MLSWISKGPNNEIIPLTRAGRWKLPALIVLLIAPFVVAGCTTTGGTASKAKTTQTAAASHTKSVNGVKTYSYTSKDRECLERAMFFESNRSSPDGLVAVGTVVMNRLANEKYPDTICGVVGQKKQFAPGVLSRKMNSKALPDVQSAADAVLKGKRHPALKNSMFFHTAGLKFPYRNMHYVLVAGGNSFYEKRGRDGKLENPVPQEPYNLAFAYAPQSPSVEEGPIYDVMQSQTPSAVQLAAVETVKESAPDQSNGTQAHGTLEHGSRVAQLTSVPVPQTASVQVASYEQPHQAETAKLGFVANQKEVDAIGALLLAQDRPEAPF